MTRDVDAGSLGAGLGQPEIAAVIVNYNAGDDLRAGLQSLSSELGHLPHEIVVFDNASSDGSAAVVADFAPAARLVQGRENVGFGRGVNLGVAATSAPLVLIMNPDCRLVDGAVETLRHVLERHDRCALVGPRILNPDGTVQGSARGDPDMLTGLFGRTGALQRILPGTSVARRNVVSEEALAAGDDGVVDWLSGACVLVKRRVFDDAGGFDPKYFMYWEDADLCRRLRTRGYHVRYVPAATAIHKVGQSSRTARASAIRAFHDSAYKYYATHVAPHPLDPRRAIARALLAIRRTLHLMRA